jgi:hypothetical protein
VPLSPLGVYLGLLAISVALTPLGLALLRGGEWLLRHRFGLTVVERLLLALFASGTLLLLVASVPLHLYTRTGVVLLLALGAGALAATWIRERGASLGPGVRWFRSGYGLLVSGLFVGLLAAEVVGAGTAAFPNVYDGSFQSLFAQLILSHSGVVWTLQPYSNTGVTYPQGAAVWLTVPVMLLGWPVLAAPVALPLLFLTLSVPAAYCWGERMWGIGTGGGRRAGLLFAAFFALVASWPRLFIGGSYDFAIALPIFFVAVGWLRPFVAQGAVGWSRTIAFGVVTGALTALSLAAGESLVLILVACLLAFTPWTFAAIRAWLVRLVANLAIVAAFVTRSWLGVATWWDYPQHVLSPVGSPPYAAQSGLPTFSWSALLGDIDPFTPFKLRLSPIPSLSLTIAILLAAGLAILVAWWVLPRSRWRRWLPATAVEPLTVATAAALLWTAWLQAIGGTPLGVSVFDDLASLYEAPFVLFVFYSVIALLPLIMALEYLVAMDHARAVGKRRPATAAPTTGAGAARSRRRKNVSLLQVGAVAVLLVPIGVGGYVTTASVPGYLGGHLHGLANVTAGDANALEWSGGHLPSCARVLAAPGTAAMFLPLYADVTLDFPMLPVPVNLSYVTAVGDLIHGSYTPATRADLLELGITVVFVTAQNSVSYLPIDPAPLESSSDFSLLYASGDAQIFGFVPGESVTECTG